MSAKKLVACLKKKNTTQKNPQPHSQGQCLHCSTLSCLKSINHQREMEVQLCNRPTYRSTQTRHAGQNVQTPQDSIIQANVLHL